MKAIILDDDAQIAGQLDAFLDGALQIVAQATSVEQAKALIEQEQPDLVFLEARLHSGNGLRLIDLYGEELPFDFVVISKSDSYAIDAYQRFAVDYLAKPLQKEDVLRAISKVKSRNEALWSALNKEQVKHSGKIALPTQDGFLFIRQSDIIRCEAQGNYTQVYLNDGRKLMITKTLKHYEELLLEGSFFRAHKSHLINLDYVRKFIKGKQSYIETIDGMSIEVSTRKREALLQRLSFTE
ncbi:MAG: LytTR family DNA-binding domain-containing protein [Saprospiraceae bacterium]|nr:LytTR family DNA-binding domain-containing protein [Saprospiraceae bacterium]